MTEEPKSFTPNSAIFMMSRIRLARNLAGEKFSNAAGARQLEAIYRKCSDALVKVRRLKDGKVSRMEELTPFARDMLVEDRTVSKELADGGTGKGAFISKDGSAAVMINEEDHLRIQVIARGNALPALWRSVNALDDAIEEHVEYAFSADCGYQTACPTNVGTGMRASLMMHLPALVLTDQMDKIIRGVNQLGMVVRGANGEGSDSFGAIFQLSNQQTLGMTEADIVKKISRFGKKIAEFETNARLKLEQDKPLILADKFSRARAVLESCRMIDTAEAMSCLSNLRLASDMGFLGGAETIELIDSLFLDIQPSHLQLRFGIHDASPAERDALRASLLNSQARALPKLGRVS